MTILYSLSLSILTSYQHVKNQLERVPDQFTPLWKWRSSAEGKSNNGLSEGEDGPREMHKLAMADREYNLVLTSRWF